MADRWLPFAFSFSVTCLLFLDVCAWLFGCGCRSLWAGADAACNVHAAVGPRCPFCTRGIAGYAGVLAAVTAPQLICAVRAPWSRAARTLACVALFPAAMIAVALLMGWYDGYWQGRP